MSRSISINNFLCDIESGEIKIDWFNMRDIKLMKWDDVLCKAAELTTGDFDSVYNFIYREYWSDCNVMKVIVQYDKQTQIIIDWNCDNPVLEKIIPIKGV